MTTCFAPFFRLVSVILILVFKCLTLFSQETDQTDTTSSPAPYFRYQGGEVEHTGPELSGVQPEFRKTSILLNNSFGSYESRNNGFEGAVITEPYGFYGSYKYINNDGYRKHSSESWNQAAAGVRVNSARNTSLVVWGSWVSGLIRLPGSLTSDEFNTDPYKADPRSVDRDQKTLANKQRVDLKYITQFGKNLNNQIQVSAHGTLGQYECATQEYRIINSYYPGVDAHFSNYSRFWNRRNLLECGTEVTLKSESTDYYDNIGGMRGDQIEQITNEKTTTAGVYLTDRFEILTEKLILLLNGRYDNVVYKVNEQTVPSRSDRRPYSALTPKAQINYSPFHVLTLTGSFNLGFASPADEQLESPDPFFLFNPVLSAQTSVNYAAGLIISNETEKENRDSGKEYENNRKDQYDNTFTLKAMVYQNYITNEIVPYEVLGDVYFRNAGKANHTSLRIDGRTWLFNALLFKASYSYSDFTYKSYPTISMEPNSSGTLVQVDRDFSGKAEPAVPSHQLNTSLSYLYTVADHASVKGEISYVAVDRMWVDDANTQQTGSYQTMNALLGFDLKSGHFNLLASAGVNNIFKSIYAGDITINSAYGRFYNAASPLSWTAALNLGYFF